ncbi:50S ribosomal protein L5 [Candidatus Falkowbacteria bacterium RIFOXYD2_FULL_35_9]|uniref:Large ribosomal subunit protein uL5 n=1 Tax=Candidatus Falkowbacteria bacterium RIFOXYC2_FULL_36_12 TaxID=1798002 RepID=A0A1F5SW85_9BACT|nr:MAG: 50S ribosomal protein L5 [Candidatus Falkowbacteria bacterium RIFOXYB2_FULL_35_7]OGF30970.1 MAG: 50S ribosomal protein L5 [Candidatus Falkowbacteria bacterium RIFOXYC2_FULL_36_12]OGF34398.1 MAG: 50S ribosomal protein L5 [Candidatus Falkowbacteria bacterium RIFOXYA2_FULL_35_8]OGF47295.1 MAG: 50S ribosomal protein L5 [Candidatus Falkowbacteria bacterium RIFOXYD2_FULL_35_9]
MQGFKKHYQEKIIPALKEKFGYKNNMQVPTMKKVVLNVGIGAGLKDKDYIDAVEKNLQRITGQMPVKTLAKKSISNFKIREGMVVGLKVTLRGDRMWDFVEKLVKVTLPRVRDFQGINPKSFDGMGGYSLGFKEQLAFPEILPDEVDRTHGLEINITTSAKNNEEAFEFLNLLGFPFKKQ